MRRYETLYVMCADPRDPIGGAETSFLQMLQDVPEECECALVVAASEGTFTCLCRAQGVDVVISPMATPIDIGKRNILTITRYVYKLFRQTLPLLQLIRNHDIQLVSTLSRGAHPYGAIAGRLARCPAIMHIRDIPQSRFAIIMYRLLVRYFAKRVVVFSQVVRDTIGAAPEKFAILSMGIDLQQFHPQTEPLSPTQARVSFPILCTAGRISPHKGLTELVQALKQVVNVFPQTSLLIAGQEWANDACYQRNLHALIEQMGLTDNVRFVGQLSLAQMPAFLVMADVVVVASRFESFGRTVVEGMALAKPIIATRCGGPQEIITHGHDGLLVDVNDAASMAEMIIYLAQNDNIRAQMGKSGRATVEQRYDARNYAPAILAVHQEVLRQAMPAASI